MLMKLKPLDVYFSQDSIRCAFRNGESVNETIDSIIDDKVLVADIPHITVVKLKERYYSQNNRRLYIFRVLHCLGYLNEIWVNTSTSVNSKQFTTKNKGESVRVRGDQTRNHTYRETTRTQTKIKDEDGIEKELTSAKPSDIRFYCDAVQISADLNRNLQKSVDLLQNGANLNLTLDIFVRKKKCYAVRPLMLYLARVLEFNGKLSDILVKVTVQSQKEITTTCDGDHLEIKGASKLWEHSRQIIRFVRGLSTLRI